MISIFTNRLTFRLTLKTGVAPLVLSCLLFLMGCSKNSPTPAQISPIPCPPSVTRGAESGVGRYLFFKMGCDYHPPESPVFKPHSHLLAIDPINPTVSFEVESSYLGGSLQEVPDGEWNMAHWAATGKILNKKPRFMIYAKQDGRFYKVSTVKGEGLVPTQFSNEQIPKVDGELEFCGGYVLSDYSNINESPYLYTDPGPDQRCYTRDDNLQKIIKLSMSGSDSPLVIPNNNADIIEYAGALTSGVAPGSPIENRLSIVTDLVEKTNGGIAGWLVVKKRTEKKVLQPAFFVRDTNRDTLETTLAHGLSEGMPVQLDFKSGASFPSGLVPNKIYYVHVTSARTFKLYTIKKEARQRLAVFRDGSATSTSERCEVAGPGCKMSTVIELRGGKTPMEPNQLGVGHRHPQPEECVGDPDPTCYAVNPDVEGGLEQHQDLHTVDIFSNGEGIIQPLVGMTDLYRYNKELTHGTLLKETKFLNICTISGHDQVLGTNTESNNFFTIQVTNERGQPVPGIVVSWTATSRETCSSILGVITLSCTKAEIMAISGLTTDVNGYAWARGKTGPSDTEESGNRGKEKSIFFANIGGGGKVAFTIMTNSVYWDETKTPKVLKRTPPSCGMRPDFSITNIIPMSYGNFFTGKMVVRMDLAFRPHPDDADKKDATKKDKERAKASGIKGELYIYDIAANTFSPLVYTSKVPYTDGTVASFPDGGPILADVDALYFFDNSDRLDLLGLLPFEIEKGVNPIQHRTLIRLPFNGGSPTILASEIGRQAFSQLALTTNRLVYSTIDRSVSPEITVLKSVGKLGGDPVTLMGPTPDSLFPVITAGTSIYYQTQGATPPCDATSPSCHIGVLSKIVYVREDGVGSRPVNRASFVGRTDTRILAMVNCFELTFSCAGGTLISFNPLAPLEDAINLGPVPNDAISLYFQGSGEKVLLEGDTAPTSDGSPSDGSPVSRGTDIFYVQGDQGNSLVRVTKTPDLPETLP